MRFEPTFHTSDGTPIGSLCQMCQNAVPTYECGCSWSRDFQPVNGWTAVPTRLKDTDDGEEVAFSSFCVMECPEFLADGAPRKSVEPIVLEKPVRIARKVTKEPPRPNRVVRHVDPGRPYCKFSTMILCDRGPEDICAKCGWNPETEKVRKANLH